MGDLGRSASRFSGSDLIKLEGGSVIRGKIRLSDGKCDAFVEFRRKKGSVVTRPTSESVREHFIFTLV